MLASRYYCIILAAFSLCLNHVMYCTGSMSEIPGEKAQMQGEGEGEGQIPKLFLVTKCIKLPVDILNELPYIALFYHRATVSDLLRSWIVESASDDQNALIPEVQERGEEDTKAGAEYILKYFRLAMLSSSLAFSFSSAIDVYLWLYERYEVPSYAIAIMSMAFAIITAILMKYEDISSLPS